MARVLFTGTLFTPERDETRIAWRENTPRGRRLMPSIGCRDKHAANSDCAGVLANGHGSFPAAHAARTGGGPGLACGTRQRVENATHLGGTPTQRRCVVLRLRASAGLRPASPRTDRTSVNGRQQTRLRFRSCQRRRTCGGGCMAGPGGQGQVRTGSSGGVPARRGQICPVDRWSHRPRLRPHRHRRMECVWSPAVEDTYHQLGPAGY